MGSKEGRRARKYGPESKKHISGRAMTPALLEALNHPVRRQLLRLLQERRIAQSPLEMSQGIAFRLTNIAYHARVLSDLAVVRLVRTRQVRGSTQHFYASKVAKNELVAAILASTEKADSLICSKSQRPKSASSS